MTARLAVSVRRKLPVGIENFEEIRKEGFYYVDKTTMIRDLLDRWSKVKLFTRPRRFGRSLNMSMLKAFFEIGCDKPLFEGLKIWEETELCEQYMGRFPMVWISLKGVGADDLATARGLMVMAVNMEAPRLRYLLESGQLSPEDKKMLALLMEYEIEDEVLCCSLRIHSGVLQKHHGQKAIILIDEYDVPLAKADEKGYYRPMATLIWNLFDQTLKTNESLYLAVLTCWTIRSIISGACCPPQAI